MQKKPTIALSLGGSKALYHAFAEEARWHDWHLLDLRLTHFIIPPDPAPAGAIISYWPPEKLVLQCQALDCPIVKLGMVQEEGDGGLVLPSVLTDPRLDGVVAADYFFKRGFRNVAYVGNDPWAGARPTFEGFRDRSEELGVELHLLRLSKELGEDRAKQFQAYEQVIGDWLSEVPKPVGLLAYHDHMASKVCSICLFRGISVPEQVAILGIGNSVEQCELSPVQLSSVEHNESQIAAEACSLMARIWEEPSKNGETIVVPPKGIAERQSTNIMAFDDPRVAKAMHFLWEHLSWPISVDDVVREVGGARRPLERAFRKHICRGIKEELLRKRLEKSAMLLSDTDMTVASVAAAVGLKSMPYFYKVFRQAYGKSPREYRLRHG